jgi:undecaprenyl-diphosphatase
MNLNIQLLWAFLISFVSFIGFSFMAILISRHDILTFDSTIISYIQGLEMPALTAIMKLFTFIGSGNAIVVIAVIVIFFLYKVLHHRSELLFFIIVVLGAGIFNGMLKDIFQRARPDFHRLIEIGGYSFPSGHAMSALAVYGALAFLLWRHTSTRFGRVLLILFSAMMIFMIGISRVYLGVHYPSDIIGGYFASGFWLAVAIWSYQRYKERRFKNKKMVFATLTKNPLKK